MNKTNQMFRLFAEMKKGYRDKNEIMFQHGAQCWLDYDPENPFTPDTPEYNAFFQMKKCYTIWKRGDIDRKINRRRMFEWAEQLCKINPKQPYKFDKAADEADKKEAEEEAKRVADELANQPTITPPIPQKVVITPKKVVLGVPDTKKISPKTVEQPDPIENEEEEQPKKSFWKRLTKLFKKE